MHRRAFASGFRRSVVALAVCVGVVISAPAQVGLINVGHIKNTNNNGQAYDVAVSGNYAYLANYRDGLRVYDISNPANLVNVGHTNNSATIIASAQALALVGAHVFFASADDGLRVYDVSNPAQPKNISHTNNSTAFRAYASDIVVINHLAYLANGTDGLRIYDVSNPATPKNIGHTNNLHVIAVGGAAGRAYVGASGLGVYDVLPPGTPLHRAFAATSPHLVHDIAISGDFAFVANSDAGLKIYNITNPANPVVVGTALNGIGTAGVTISGNYAYVAAWGAGIRVLDISNPAQPLEVGSAPRIGNGFAARIAVSGGHLYLANMSDGLRSYAILPKLSIQTVGSSLLRFSWSATSAFRLQSKPVTGPGDWATLPDVPTSSGSHDELLLPQPPVPTLYRLVAE